MTIESELYRHIPQLSPELVVYNTAHIERAFRQYLPANYKGRILVLGAGYGWELLALRSMYPESSIMVTEEDQRYYENNPLYKLRNTTFLPQFPLDLENQTVPGLVIARAPFVINQVGIEPQTQKLIPFPNNQWLSALVRVAQALPPNGLMFISTYMSIEADVIASEFDKKGVEAERQTHTPADFNPPGEMIQEIPSINELAFPEHEVLLIRNR